MLASALCRVHCVVYNVGNLVAFLHYPSFVFFSWTLDRMSVLTETELFCYYYVVWINIWYNSNVCVVLFTHLFFHIHTAPFLIKRSFLFFLHLFSCLSLEITITCFSAPLLPKLRLLTCTRVCVWTEWLWRTFNLHFNVLKAWKKALWCLIPSHNALCYSSRVCVCFYTSCTQ